MSQIQLHVTNKNGDQLPINQKIDKSLFDENGNLTVHIEHEQILFCFERVAGEKDTIHILENKEKESAEFTLKPVTMNRTTVLPTIVLVTSRNTATGYKIGLITWKNDHYLCLIPKWVATYSTATKGFMSIKLPQLIAELLKPEYLNRIQGMETIRRGSARKPEVGEVKVKYWDLEKGYGIGLMPNQSTVLLRAEHFQEDITLPFLPVDTFVSCDIVHNYAQNTAEFLAKEISVIEVAEETITSRSNSIGASIPKELIEKLYSGTEGK